jgi:hypothetical protein
MTTPLLVLLLAALAIVIAGRSWLQRGGRRISPAMRIIAIVVLVVVAAGFTYDIFGHGRTAP